MRLVGYDDQESDDGLNIDMEDADTQELEAIAYRFTQILPDQCEALAKILAHGDINHPVIFLCDVGDSFGLAIARKVCDQALIDRALQETGSDARPGIISGVDLDDLEGKELTIFYTVKSQMTGIIGYFPIVVAAKGGFSVFPWPFKLKEKSKFKLFSSV